jgi:hypothetical protein
VRGRVAHAGDARHGGGGADQPGKPDGAAILAEPVIGVDVLPEQRDLAHAGAGEAGNLVDDRANRTRGLGAAGIGHDAERAELVAALLHGHERRDAATANRAGRADGKMSKLVLGREVGGDDAGPQARFAHELRQAMITLRTDHDIDRRLAAQDFRSLGLRYATGDDQRRPPPPPAALVFEFAQLAELGIDLLRRPFADMAGVEDDEIGVLDRMSLAVALFGRNIRHSLGVVDVHLASERLDEHPSVLVPSGTRTFAGVFKHKRLGQLAAPERS